jgi:hypothetical protein
MKIKKEGGGESERMREKTSFFSAVGLIRQTITRQIEV